MNNISNNSTETNEKSYEVFEKNIKETKEIFSNRFKTLLKEKGFTQKSFAKISGISEGSISKFINEESIPKESLLIVIANQLNVSKDYLIGKSECPTYTFEDITEKTGLSQKAIEKLYQLQHDYFLFENNIEVDIQEKRKISKQYKEHIDILNSILENDVYLFWLLDSIRKYKLKNEELDNAKDIIEKFDIKEELATQEDRIQRRFLELVKEIIKKEQ